MCFAPQRRALFRHIISVLYILIWKRASCHNGVHFFDITTSKSAPTLVCFVHFDLEMRFAPQRRAISSLIWPDGSAPAALASLLFDHPEPQTIGNPQCFAALLPFRAPVFFLLALSLLWSCLFCSSPLWLFPPLLFPSAHIVGSLTSKLPDDYFPTQNVFGALVYPIFGQIQIFQPPQR